jgi:hypothetical protein
LLAILPQGMAQYLDAEEKLIIAAHEGQQVDVRGIYFKKMGRYHETKQ